MSSPKVKAFSPVVSEIAYYAVAVALPLVMSLVGMGWVVRLVSPQDFGKFNLINVTGSIASTASFYWLGQWILRYATRFVEPQTSEMHWAVLWRLSLWSVA